MLGTLCVIDMQACAYCDVQNTKLTKEHLWPACLHKRIDKANRSYIGARNLFYLAKNNRVFLGEPQIKDVCANCNNKTLSVLDAYICKLWDTYFNKIVEASDDVTFLYDYNLLSRWLLKMCFNSSRIHDSDRIHLTNCRHYILGTSPHPENVTIHLQLVKPGSFTADEREAIRAAGFPAKRYEPRLNRVGHLTYPTRAGVGRVIRAVHLQSYLFLLHVFPLNVPPDNRRRDLEDFQTNMPFAVALNADSGGCTAHCEGIDSKESFYSHFLYRGAPRGLDEV